MDGTAARPARPGDPAATALATADERFDYVHAPTEVHEGGYFADPRAGDTQYGLSQDFWDMARRNRPAWAALPARVTALDRATVRRILRAEFYDVPGIDALAGIGSILVTAPQLVQQVYDTAVLSGQPVAMRLLREAVAAVGAPSTPPKWRRIDKHAVADIARILAQGRIVALNDALVERRLAWLRGLPDAAKYPGWIRRAESYRIAATRR
ncbi:MAG: glycosyl hydrolase 108 family protein [Alphaproteobacteria bacterium]